MRRHRWQQTGPRQTVRVSGEECPGYDMTKRRCDGWDVFQGVQSGGIFTYIEWKAR